MPKINGQFKKFNELDKFAIVDQKDISGGLHFVENSNDLNAIPAEIQKRGMHVMVGDTGQTWINEGAYNAWQLKPEILTINGQAADEKNEVNIDRFKTLSADKIVVSDYGIEHQNQNGQIKPIMGVGFDGEGVIIGDDKNDSAIVVKQNLRVLQTDGNNEVISAAHMPSSGTESRENSLGYVTKWKFAFPESCVLEAISFVSDKAANKSLVQVHDANGELIGSSTSKADFLNAEPNSILSGSKTTVFLSKPAYIIGCQPITITIQTDKDHPVSIGYGHSEEYGFNTATVDYSFKKLIHGAVEHSGSSYQGNMRTNRTIISPNGLKLVEETSTAVTYPLYANDKKSAQKNRFDAMFHTFDHNDFKPMVLHKLYMPMESADIKAGIYANIVLFDANQIPKVERYTTIKPTKLLPDDAYQLPLETPIMISNGDTLAITIASITGEEFTIRTDNNDNPAIELVGVESVETVISHRLFNKDGTPTSGASHVLAYKSLDELKASLPNPEKGQVAYVLGEEWVGSQAYEDAWVDTYAYLDDANFQGWTKVDVHPPTRDLLVRGGVQILPKDSMGFSGIDITSGKKDDGSDWVTWGFEANPDSSRLEISRNGNPVLSLNDANEISDKYGERLANVTELPKNSYTKLSDSKKIGETLTIEGMTETGFSYLQGSHINGMPDWMEKDEAFIEVMTSDHGMTVQRVYNETGAAFRVAPTYEIDHKEWKRLDNI